MRKQARPRRYGLIAGGAFLALALGIVIVGVAFKSKSGVSGAANLGGLVSLGISAVSAAYSLWSWWRTAAASSVVTSEEAAKGADTLAFLVGEQWKNEAKRRSLDPRPIPVQWRVTTNRQVMDHPENLMGSSLSLIASSADIAALVGEFRKMRRRRLVVLGGPGAGKTTLAVQLVQELLATRGQHADEPVPVLLSVAGWDTEEFPVLQDWLAFRLAQDYPGLRSEGPEMAEGLVKYSKILPVLDGLDELSERAQADVIAALNKSMRDDDQLILTSRTIEFGRATLGAGDILTSAVVIEPEPIQPGVAANYLRSCLRPRNHQAWHSVLDQLSSGSGAQCGSTAALAENVLTPLGLWLVRSVYMSGGEDPSILLDQGIFPDAMALRAHLLDELIPALIDSRPPSEDPAEIFRPRNRYDPDRVRHWLGHMARHLSELRVADGRVGTRDFAWWHLARDTGVITPKVRLAAGLVVLFTVGLAAGLAAELAAGLSFGVSFGVPTVLGIGLAFGLVVGLASGLMVGLTAGAWPMSAPGFANLQIRGRISALGRRLVVILAPGLGLALVIWFLDQHLLTVLAVALTVGLAASLALGLTTWAEAPARTGPPASTPLGSWQADRSLTFVRLIAFGFAFGLTVGLAVGLSIGSSSGEAFGFLFAAGYKIGLVARVAVGVAFGMAFGLAGGLAGGFGTGEHRAWIAYVIATYRLAWKGQLPRRLMLFLDDAHRLGLLRGVGPIYQFRHAEFQDHLAAAYSVRARNEHEDLTARR